MQKYSITIAIPAYNEEDFVGQCLSSLITARKNALSYLDVYFVIVDDFSSDRTAEILKEFSSYNFIKVITNDLNKGQSYSTNMAVGMAKTDWVQIFHADDYVSQDHFSHIASILNTQCNDNPALIVTERREVGFDGRKLGAIPPLFSHSCSIPGEVQADILLRTGYLPCQVVFRREYFHLVGGVDHAYEINLDGLLWFKLSFFGSTRYSTQATSFYRRHNSSITSQANSSVLQIFEYYSTLKQMVSFSYKTSGHEICASRYMPSLIRYSLRIAKSIHNSQPDIAVDYFDIACLLIKSLPVEICREEKTELMQALAEARHACETSDGDGLDHIRDFSYDVPDEACVVNWDSISHPN